MAAPVPAGLHPACAPLAFLVGRFAGSGHGEYPTAPRFSFGQEIVVSHDGRPFLFHVSRSWAENDDGTPGRPLAMEAGFWRPQLDGTVELVLAHPTGYAEVWYGTAGPDRVELTTDVVARTTSAKEYTAGHRLYGLVDDHLLWAFDMAAMGHRLGSHVWARLRRVDGAGDQPGAVDAADTAGVAGAAGAPTTAGLAAQAGPVAAARVPSAKPAARGAEPAPSANGYPHRPAAATEAGPPVPEA